MELLIFVVILVIIAICLAYAPLDPGIKRIGQIIIGAMIVIALVIALFQLLGGELGGLSLGGDVD
jgi:hypothetical protein